MTHVVDSNAALQDGAGHDGALAAYGEAVVHGEHQRSVDVAFRNERRADQRVHQAFQAQWLALVGAGRGRHRNHGAVLELGRLQRQLDLFRHLKVRHESIAIIFHSQ